MTNQGILKGEVSLYHWPPVWLVWNQLYENWQFLFLFAKQTNPNQSNGRSTVQWYFPLKYCLDKHSSFPRHEIIYGSKKFCGIGRRSSFDTIKNIGCCITSSFLAGNTQRYIFSAHCHPVNLPFCRVHKSILCRGYNNWRRSLITVDLLVLTSSYELLFYNLNKEVNGTAPSPTLRVLCFTSRWATTPSIIRKLGNSLILC
jgi:hypothetical protein